LDHGNSQVKEEIKKIALMRKIDLHLDFMTYE
jgi:hypothetical protein